MTLFSLPVLYLCGIAPNSGLCLRISSIKAWDMFTMKNGLPPFTIGCAKHITCAATLPSSNGKYWCQNMDSYDLCMTAKAIIDVMNQTAQYPVECSFDVMLSDNIRVLDYRKPGPITTTTTTVPPTTIPPNTTVPVTTTPPNTTAPAMASMLKYTSGLITLLLLVSL